MRINGNLVFNSDATGEIQQAYIERLATAPAFNSSQKGRIYFDTTAALYYFNDGTKWQPFATGGNATLLATYVNNLIASVGTAVNSDGTWNGSSAFTGDPILAGATSITNALSLLSTAAYGHELLSELGDVALGTMSDNQFLVYNATSSKWNNHTLVLADVTDVTATAAEVNTLHGFTGSTSNLNVLSGTTASAADLNSITGFAAQSVTATEFGYLNGGTPVTSSIQAQLNNKQPLNTGLTNWATFVNGSGTGIIVQTGVNSFADRTMVSNNTDLTIANADGVAGAPTFDFAGNTAGLAALATTGFIVRTGAGTFTTDSLVSGSTSRIVVTNGDGVAASPTIDLAAVTQGSTGSFLKVTLDGYGRVSGNTAVTTGDITALVDSQYLRLDGTTTPTASINFGGFAVQGVGTPVAGTDAANKNYVDAAVVGLEWKAAVQVATTAAAVLATGFTAGTVIDGYTLVAGDRILIKNQAAPAENGIYVVTAGAPTRATDAATSAELNNATVFVTNGTANSDTGWTQTTTNPVVGTSPIVFQQFTGAGTYVAGTGLLLTGNTFSAQLGAGIAELPTGEIGVDLYGVATSALILTDNGTARATTASSQLALLLKSAGGLTQDAAGLYIPAAGVSNAMLANSTITLDVDGGGSGAVALGGTLSVFGNATQGISTSLSGTTINITAADATTASKGVAKFDPATFTVTTGNVVVSSGGISNAQLANSSWGFSGTTGGLQQIDLGTNLSVVGGSAPVTTVSAAGTLTINVASATVSTLGLASFNGSQFSVAAGAVSMAMSLGQGGITNVASSVDSAATNDLLTWNGTKWANATRSAVLGTESIGELSDVALTSPAGGQTLVYSTADSKFENRPIYFLYSSTGSSTSHSVAHNLGQKYCNVTVVDSTDEVVIPQSITFTDANNLVVTFTSAIACKVVVMGVNAA